MIRRRQAPHARHSGGCGLLRLRRFELLRLVEISLECLLDDPPHMPTLDVRKVRKLVMEIRADMRRQLRSRVRALSHDDKLSEGILADKQARQGRAGAFRPLPHLIAFIDLRLAPAPAGAAPERPRHPFREPAKPRRHPDRPDRVADPRHRHPLDGRRRQQPHPPARQP